MLKSIELIGFKSFAKRGTLDFATPVTAIVGPNGSGKSNTAEAFRFVLGEQGGKAMRVKKGTDLIWGGTNAVPKASRAGVRIVLDNSAGKLKIDFNEVAIERSVLADGTHEYSINGSKVRLKDIQDLLAGANIGSSGHHIISQGQADRILGASPKERREMLEDALGLKSYLLKKAESQRKLEATSVNLAQAQSTQRELVPQLKYLERQARAVEQARELRRELESKFAVYLSAEQAWIDKTQSLVQESLTEPQAELHEVESRISTLREQLSKLESSVSKQEVEQTTELEGQVTEARGVLEQSKQELGKVLGQLEMLSAMQGKVAKKPETVPREKVREILSQVIEELEMVEETNDKATIVSIVVRSRKVVEKFIAKVLDAKQSEAELESIEQELETLRQSKQELESKVAEQAQALGELEEQLRAVKQAQAGSAQESTALERDIYKESARYNELTSIIADLQRKSSEASMRSDRAEEDVAEVEALLGKRVGTTGEVSLEQVDMPTRRELENLKIKIETSGGISTEVVEEYDKAQEQHDFLTKQIQDLELASLKLAELIASLDKQAKEKFNNGLELINKEFDEFFKGLFGGGTAKLALEQESVEGDTEAKSGITVSVKLPRKKVTALETLSGGERALTSIALIFAMSQVNPPPFIILDETDAALDEANSRRYAEVVQRLSGKSQIILITHNRATMSVADTLYGVTMGGDGVSKLLSVKLTDAEQYAK